MVFIYKKKSIAAVYLVDTPAFIRTKPVAFAVLTTKNLDQKFFLELL